MAGEFAVSPGWYPDPLGLPQMRWWNGQGWTERVDQALAPQSPAASRTQLAWADDEAVGQGGATAPASAPTVMVPTVIVIEPSAQRPGPRQGAHVAPPRREIEGSAQPHHGGHVAPPRLELEEGTAPAGSGDVAAMLAALARATPPSAAMRVDPSQVVPNHPFGAPAR
ncbi:MAG: DUF2510 domain-containing protein [Microbacteriaceae bacterium]